MSIFSSSQQFCHTGELDGKSALILFIIYPFQGLIKTDGSVILCIFLRYNMVLSYGEAWTGLWKTISAPDCAKANSVSFSLEVLCGILKLGRLVDDYECAHVL